MPKRKPDELGQDEVSVGRAGRKTAETLNATDRIIEALELAGKEAERLQVGLTRHTILPVHLRTARSTGTIHIGKSGDLAVCE